MSRRLIVLIGLSVWLVTVVGFDARAQYPDPTLQGNIKFNSGLSLQPIFDGWTRNPDGSFEFHFGYLNRNYVEELSIPVGPENNVEPGGPDRGQPAYFYTRIQRRAFSVTVPANWGRKQEVTWTVTTRGKTERAVATLLPDWEISTVPRGSETTEPNTPPTLTLSAPASVAKPGTVTLSATVTDDGAPKQPRGRRGGGSENPPTFKWPQPTGTAPVNVPQVQRQPPPTVKARLSVQWIVWRGPAGVTFDPPIIGADSGSAAVAATFSKPGEYVLRARASDSAAFAIKDLKIKVEGQ
jgi:hypothetical protein